MFPCEFVPFCLAIERVGKGDDDDADDVDVEVDVVDAVDARRSGILVAEVVVPLLELSVFKSAPENDAVLLEVDSAVFAPSSSSPLVWPRPCRMKSARCAVVVVEMLELEELLNAIVVFVVVPLRALRDTADAQRGANRTATRHDIAGARDWRYRNEKCLP